MDISSMKNLLKQDFDDIYYKGQLETLNNYESFKGDLSGITVFTNDVNAIEHSVEVQLKSKNLFDVNLDPHSIHWAASLVSLNNGELTIKQNATAQYASYNIAIPNAKNLVGKTITISCDCKVGEGGNNTTVRVLWLNSNGGASAGTDILYRPYVSSTEYQHISVSGIVNAQPDESHDTLALLFYSNVSGTLSDGEYYAYFKNIQIELGTTETEYTPYVGDFTNVNNSKNLCSNVYADYADTSYKSLYIDNGPLRMSFVDKDTSVDVSGCYFGFCVNPNNLNGEGYRWGMSNGVVAGVRTNSSTKDGTLCPYIVFYPRSEEVFNKIMQRWDIQVEKGTVETAYEPYQVPVAAEVTRYGKNLFDASQLLVKNWSVTDGVYSGLPSYLHQVYNNENGQSLFNDFKPNTQYTVSFKGYSDDVNSVGARLFTLIFKYSDGTVDRIWIKNNIDNSYTLTSDASKTVIGLHISYGRNSMCYVRDIQLETGSRATTYEPYKELQTIAATPSGLVEGIKSVSPNMTLLSNSNNVVINANYYRDLDIYISNLQQAVALSGGE